tara:strand:- start:75 stop:239 length:165 start_codon:yes stop_codon:yes gene_type:complete
MKRPVIELNSEQLLKAFRAGYNTLEIAEGVGAAEHEICRLLHLQRQAERKSKDG